MQLTLHCFFVSFNVLSNVASFKKNTAWLKHDSEKEIGH